MDTTHPAILKARQKMARFGSPHPGRGNHRGKQKHDWEKIILLWLELGNQHRVAEVTGLNQAAVSKILTKCGIRVGKGQNCTQRIDLPVEKIGLEYLSGKSTIELAEMYGVNDETIRDRLERAGIGRRSLMESRARGPKNSQWKGRTGRYNPMHFYRRQSYEVAAICTGRPLPQGTVIHHMDENPHNNDPGNLRLFDSPRSHARFHQQLLRLQRKGVEVDAIQLALEAGGRALPPPPVPIVFEPYIIPRHGRPRKHETPEMDLVMSELF